MTTSERGKNLIKGFERCSLKAYQNKGDRPTIGWGNTFYENGTPVKLGETITQEEANKLFDHTLARFEQHVNDLIRVPINQNQFDAVVSFTYNCGWGALGDSTLLRKLNKNPNDPTIEQEFLKWISRGSPFEQGLRKRRQAEADLYFTKTS